MFNIEFLQDTKVKEAEYLISKLFGFHIVVRKNQNIPPSLKAGASL